MASSPFTPAMASSTLSLIGCEKFVVIPGTAPSSALRIFSISSSRSFVVVHASRGLRPT